MKKDVLGNFTKFTGKHLSQSLSFNKVAGQFISLEDDLPNVIDGDKKKFVAEHTNELIKKYEEFAQETRNGNHGKTAQC